MECTLKSYTEIELKALEGQLADFVRSKKSYFFDNEEENNNYNGGETHMVCSSSPVRKLVLRENGGEDVCNINGTEERNVADSEITTAHEKVGTPVDEAARAPGDVDHGEDLPNSNITGENENDETTVKESKL